MSEAPQWLSSRDGGLTVAVKAVPRARQTKAVGVQDGLLRVQIAAPPHNGQSNAALCAYLADAAGVRPNSARLRRGSSGARKLVDIDGDSAEMARRMIVAFGTIERRT